MTDGFGFKTERDAEGKFIIENDTPNKKAHHFYRQKGGSLYFCTEPGDSLVEAMKICLEASKQEQCKVNYHSSLGITQLFPEMNEQEALNSLICCRFSKETSHDAMKMRIDKMKAQLTAPESIDFNDFYLLDQFKKSGSKKVIDFCKANDIDPVALKMHYDLAVDYATSKGGSYEVQVARGTEHFGLPETITKENIPELKKRLVLSRDDPRVATMGNKTLSRDYQRE